MACAWHAVDRDEIQPGDTVVIGGVDNIGFCMLQIAKLRGPGLLIALDTKPYRLELARQLGADVVIDGTHLGPGGYAPSIRALADGSVTVAPLLADSHPLTHFAAAMQAALSGDVLKTIVTPV